MAALLRHGDINLIFYELSRFWRDGFFSRRRGFVPARNFIDTLRDRKNTRRVRKSRLFSVTRENGFDMDCHGSISQHNLTKG